jgi:hypothetical protein
VKNLNWYLSLLVLLLFIVVPPTLCSLFYLSQVPDVTWASHGGLSYDRIWLHRDRRPVGLGYQNQRVVAEYSDTAMCVENKLRFFLWSRSGSAEPGSSSQKMIFMDSRWQPTGEECR